MSQHLRKVRSFVRRNGRTTAKQKNALETLWPQFGIEYQPRPCALNDFFKNNALLNVEIGFGMGEALVQSAQNNPDQNYVGIEVHDPGIGNVLNQISELSLKNIRVISHDAVEVLDNQFENQSIDSICIFFPDPWHKKRHNKRRLLNEKFAQLVADKLKASGKLFIATDWQNYAEQILSVFNGNSDFKNLSDDNTYCPRIDFRPLTKFEKRGQRLGHDVWDFIYQRR